MTKKSTKRAFLLSILSMMLCLAMLVGSTFAWFTDSVTSGMNKIVAGNLDVELYHTNALIKDTATEEEKKVGEKTTLFVSADENFKWEPGAMLYENFTVKNAGSLALKYKLMLKAECNTTEDGVSLENVLKVAVMKETFSGERAEAMKKDFKMTVADFVKSGAKIASGELLKKGDAENCAIIIYWEPSNNDDLYNFNKGQAEELYIKLGVNLTANQAASESDSFDKDYDAEAPAATYKVTPDTIDEYLSGEHGSISNAKLVLAPGNYGKLLIGLPSKYDGGDTVYTCLSGNNHSGEPLSFKSSSEFIEHLSTSNWHATPNYLRTIDNLTIVGQEGVTVEGLLISSGHAHGGGNNVFDPVLDKEVASAGYYMTQKITNLTFKDITFTAKCDITTSQANTVIDGVTYDGCTFNIGSTKSDNQAIRFYNENNNGNVRNLFVRDCSFNNCYQGVYTSQIYGVSVIDCTFDTTGHNAIAIQCQGGNKGPANHGAVVITGNKFTDIHDRIIRFNEVGADTQITIKYNTATNSGDEKGEVIKATSFENGVTFDVSCNNWGEGKKAGNPEFQDTSITVTSYLKDAIEKAQDDAVIYLAKGTYSDVSFVNPASYTAKNLTIIGEEGATVNGMSFSDWSPSEQSLKIDGLTLKNITFTGNLLLSVPEMKNVTVSECKFINDAGINQNDGTEKITNLTVKNCTFTGDDNKTNNVTAIHLENAENVSISGCEFNNIHFNAIQAGTLKGTVLIDGNKINGTGDRVFRFVTVEADLTISNNTIISNGDKAGELAKSNNLCQVTLSNNTWNGMSDADVAEKLINITSK